MNKGYQSSSLKGSTTAPLRGLTVQELKQMTALRMAHSQEGYTRPVPSGSMRNDMGYATVTAPPPRFIPPNMDQNHNRINFGDDHHRQETNFAINHSNMIPPHMQFPPQHGILPNPNGTSPLMMTGQSRAFVHSPPNVPTSSAITMKPSIPKYVVSPPNTALSAPPTPTTPTTPPSATDQAMHHNGLSVQELKELTRRRLAREAGDTHPHLGTPVHLQNGGLNGGHHSHSSLNGGGSSGYASREGSIFEGSEDGDLIFEKSSLSGVTEQDLDGTGSEHSGMPLFYAARGYPENEPSVEKYRISPSFQNNMNPHLNGLSSNQLPVNTLNTPTYLNSMAQDHTSASPHIIPSSGTLSVSSLGTHTGPSSQGMLSSHVDIQTGSFRPFVSRDRDHEGIPPPPPLIAGSALRKLALNNVNREYASSSNSTNEDIFVNPLKTSPPPSPRSLRSRPKLSVPFPEPLSRQRSTSSDYSSSIAYETAESVLLTPTPCSPSTPRFARFSSGERTPQRRESFGDRKDSVLLGVNNSNGGGGAAGASNGIERKDSFEITSLGYGSLEQQPLGLIHGLNSLSVRATSEDATDSSDWVGMSLRKTTLPLDHGGSSKLTTSRVLAAISGKKQASDSAGLTTGIALRKEKFVDSDQDPELVALSLNDASEGFLTGHQNGRVRKGSIEGKGMTVDGLDPSMTPHPQSFSPIFLYDENGHGPGPFSYSPTDLNARLDTISPVGIPLAAAAAAGGNTVGKKHHLNKASKSRLFP